MLRSGNDAAIVLAKNVAGSNDNFAKLMNKLATDIGMKNSYFINPHGLEDNDGNGNISTAKDMALLTRYAMKNKVFREIFGTKKYTVKTNYKTYSWTNKNKLLLSEDYITGGKTGFTKKAHRTLVTTGSRNNINVVIVTLNDGKEENVITYTDIVGVMMSSVSTIINVISYVLIAFVGISLVVSSIMIGIITYISVLERTKEIGILRSIGASKKDVSRVFNAETLIIGLVAGLIGIVVTLLLNIPINMIIKSIVGISNISKLPTAGAIILVVISVGLTMIAGLIPARFAAKRDPVEALRTE